jgi:uncharacterized membrane protein HdeD (DUF308 family)
MSARRRHAATALVVVTALLLAAAGACAYARSALVDPAEFSARMASALDDDDVRAVVAERVVGGLATSVVPDALAVRPLAVHAVGAIAASTPFRRAFAGLVGDRHRALMAGETAFTFDLRPGEGVLFDGIRSVSPRLARAIPADLRVPVLRLDPKAFELAGARALRTVAGWWWPLLLAAVAAAAACSALAGGWRAAVVHLGMAVAAAGLFLAAGVAGLGELVVAHAAHATDLGDEAERGAVRAVLSALFSDLVGAAAVMGIAGVAVAAVAAGDRAARLFATPWRLVRRLAGSPRRPARVARGALLVALGAALVLEPALALRIAAVLAGAGLVLLGVAQLAGASGREEERPARPARAASPLPIAVAIAATLALMGLTLAVILPAPQVATVAVATPAGGCNGARELCGRRLDEVVFAATHNSYAAADEPGWLFANQRLGIARQLRDGIRAFLIDIHSGAPDPQSGRIRTDLAAEGSSRNKVARQLSPAALRTADRLVGRAGVGRPTGERRPYLCHTLCELGAEPLDDQLGLFRDFLAANPREVVVLFVEPYVPVQEIERGFEEAELLGQAAALRRDEPLPTLGELIRAGTRLVVLTEKDGGARPWYLPGFSFAQDTPLGARSGAELRCARFRGTPDSPLFLVNHWIDTFPPSPSRNGRIGGAALARRLARCERRRALLPNLVAVDFHERSGVVEVVQRLNAR